MNITERLKCIADMVEPCNTVADIGTDHAYMPIYLAENKICRHAIATDVKDGPLSRAEKNIKVSGFSEYISVRKGEGLKPINPYEADYAIIAGMGGYLICDILNEGKRIADTIKRFIIQPMQYADVLRKFLHDNDYRIYDEKLIKENGKIFQVIAVEHGTDYIDNEIYYQVGKLLIEKNDPILSEFINERINELKIKINKIRDCGSAGARFNKEKYNMELLKYEEVLLCIRSARKL